MAIDFSGAVNSYNSGANQIVGNYGSAGAAIGNGYNNLLANTVGLLSTTHGSDRQGIYDDYIASRGKARSSLVSRGLGNTTIRDAIDRGALSSKWKADTASDDAFGNRLAQYMSSIGMAGLDSQSRFGLAGLGAAGGFLNSGANLALDYARLSEASNASGGGGGGAGGTGFRSPYLGPVGSIIPRPGTGGGLAWSIGQF